LKTIGGALLGIGCTLLVLYLLETLPGRWAVAVIAAYVFVMSSVITGDAKRSLFFLLIIGIPLNVDFMVTSRDSARLATNGIYVSIVDIAVIGLILLWSIGKDSNHTTGDGRTEAYREISKAALAYLGVNILSLVVSHDKTWCVYGIINSIKLFAIFFVAGNSIKTKREIKYVCAFILVSLFVQSVIYIVQQHLGSDFDALGKAKPALDFYGSTRVRGFMGANTSGNFFSACVVLGMSLFLLERGTVRKVLIGIAIGLGLCGLVLTLTRIAWVSCILCCMTLLIIGLKRRWLRFRLLVPLLVILVIIVMGSWSSIIGRLEKYDSGSAYSRIPGMILMARITKDYPILGVGVNNYADVRGGYVSEDVRDAPHYPHNQYFLVLVETGGVGFLVFMWFLYAVLKNGIKTIGSRDFMKSALAAGISMSIVSVCIANLTNSNEAGPVANLMWFLAGFISAIDGVLGGGSSIDNACCDT
jgi:O-antigen ligase